MAPIDRLHDLEAAILPGLSDEDLRGHIQRLTKQLEAAGNELARRAPSAAATGLVSGATSPAPHFMGLVVGLERVWSMLVPQVPDLQRLDPDELKSAEITTYQLAAANAADRHGLPVFAFIEGVISALNDIRKLTGKAAIDLVGSPVRPVVKA